MNLYYKLVIFLLPNIIFAEGIVIDFDKTIFVQLFIFIIFGFIIQKLIVNPVVNILDEREAATTGSKDESKDMLEKIDIISADYEEKLKSAKKEALLAQEDSVKQVSIKLSENLSNEKNILDKKIDKFVTKLEDEKLVLKKSLEKESKEIADLIVKKVMG